MNEMVMRVIKMVVKIMMIKSDRDNNSGKSDRDNNSDN